MSTYVPRTFTIVFLSIPFNIRDFSDKIIEQIKTKFYEQFFFPENRVYYKKMWKNFGTSTQATDKNIM